MEENMIDLAKLIEGLAEWDGRGIETLTAIAREVAAAGYMRRRSSAVDDIDCTTAANLLIAANTPYVPKRPALSVPIFRSLKKRINFWNPPPDLAFNTMSAAETFEEAIEACLQDAASIRQWFVAGLSPSEAIDYIVNYTCAMRVILRNHDIPRAIIKIARKEHEPTYHCQFMTTEEILSLMGEGPVPDRRIGNFGRTSNIAEFGGRNPRQRSHRKRGCE
jgi:hypothetical protein